MKQLIVISATGSESPGVVQKLTRIVLDCGGNIVESRLSVLASEMAMLMMVSGNWHTLSKLEKKLNDFGGLKVTVRNTQAGADDQSRVPYAVDVVCLDQTGIVHNLAGFFTSKNIEIAEMNTRTYSAAHTGTSMFSVQMAIKIPGSMHISTLREEFMEFCDQFNLDAILEPVKL